MKKVFFFCFAAFLLYSFTGDEANDFYSQAIISQNDSTVSADSLIDTIAIKINFIPGINYEKTKLSNIALKKSLINSNDSTKKQEIEGLILNEIIPYWYKTPWEFSGYTDVPKKGNIACGYFVSTVLKHAGFNLNRYKLAQQDPLNEAKTIALQDTVPVLMIDAVSLQAFFIRNYAEGLYFAGLDFHVGFLLFRKKELYFIHSNYINAEGVVFEKAIYSEAFRSSNAYRIAPVSTNTALLNAWISNKEIKVKTGKKN